MIRSLAAISVGVSFCANAWAGGLVVWMEPGTPPPAAVDRAVKLTTATDARTGADMAFLSQPSSAEDDKRYAALQMAINAAKSKWNDFDVEMQIASDLDKALDPIDVIRDTKDRDIVVEARLWQGAAIARAFDANEFTTGSRAAPWREQIGEIVANKPWARALALDAAVTDAKKEPTTKSDFDKLASALVAVPDGSLSVANLPAGSSLFVDGTEGKAVGGLVSVRPGSHYVHVVRNGAISGRQIISVESGDRAAVTLAVSAAHVTDAHAKVLAGTTTGLPDDVKGAIDRFVAGYDGPVFIAATQEGKTVVLPYAHDARLLKNQPVTVVLAGEIGPEVVISPIFDEHDGQTVTAPGASGSLGAQLGIYYGAILGGLDIAVTPGHTVSFLNNAGNGNVDTSVLLQPWGGVGVYFLRPIGTKPSLLLAGTYGWNGPAHAAFGGKLTIGVPLKEEGSRFHITLGGNAAGKSLWDQGDAKTPEYVFYLRLGLGGAL
jgi:hypothetical protein